MRIVGSTQSSRDGLVDGLEQEEENVSVARHELSEQERQRILVDWNATDWEYAGDPTIVELFEAQVERAADGVAVVFEDQQLTYGELNGRANCVAHYLRELGVGPDVLVGVCMERSPEMVIGLLGVLKAGGAYIPLDPTYPPEHLSFMLRDAAPLVVLTQERLLDRLPAYDGQVVCLDRDWEVMAKESRANPTGGARTENLAYVIYTSGSTGKPKGVMIEHRSLANFVQTACREYELSAQDRVLQFASISFDTSVEEIFASLVSGAALVLRTDSMLDSVSTFIEKCQEWAVTVLDLPTAYWHELTRQLGSVRLPPAVRLVIIGGEAALPQYFAAWQEAVDGSVRLVNSYGPSEATVVATLCDLPVRNDGRGGVPIGRPIANVQVYVLDQELEPVPVGVPGELHIGGAGVSRGYLNRPDLTAERFIPNRFSSKGGRLYKTGDLACFRSDGNLEFVGRIDHQVKIRGFRIELGAIEAALGRQPGVGDVVVLAREDEPGDKRLVAYVVAKSNAQLSATALLGALRETLPSYMVPASFVFLDTLPLTPNGKIDRKALPPPAALAQRDGRDVVAPRTMVEHQLAGIWEEVLSVQPIGIRDNFFDLGGHSLLAARIVARIEEECGRSIPISTLAANPTIEELAEVLRHDERVANRSPLVAIRPEGSKRPFFYLHGDFGLGGLYCWSMVRHLGTDRPVYAFEPHGAGSGPISIPLSVEDMATSFLPLLRAAQPEGPYLLGGMCSGALVAFEMAQRLRAAGEAVDVVVIVDPPWVTKPAKWTQVWMQHGAGLLGMPPERQVELYVRLRRLYGGAQLVRDNLVRRVLGLTGRHPADLNEADPRASWRDFTFTANDQERFARYDWVDLSYRLKPYDGRVALLVAQEWADRHGAELRRWRAIGDDVEVHVVPGDHRTFVTRHIATFAQELGACLESAERREPSRQVEIQVAGG